MSLPGSGSLYVIPDGPQDGFTAAADVSSDEGLVTSLRRGDAAAFEQLVRLHGGRLLAVARRLLANEEDARDTVQDAFLSAFRNIGQFEGSARLSTWLHRIVVNAALMRLRTRRRRPETLIDDLLPAFGPDGHHREQFEAWTGPPEDLLIQADTRRIVRAAIDRLPDNYRIVLLLRDIDERSTAETAEILGLSPNAVKIRLHRARQALRTLLDPHFRSQP